MDLLSRGIITLDKDKKPGFLGIRSAQVFVSLTGQPTHAAAHVQAVLAVISTKPVVLTQFILDAQRVFGAGMYHYVGKHLVPALITQGLLELRAEKKFGIFPITRRRHTPAGEQLRQHLEQQIAQAKTLPDLLTTNPTEAGILAVSLGSVLWLVPELKAHYRRLSEVLEREDHTFDALELTVDLWEISDVFDSSFGSDGGSDGGGGGGD